MKQPSIDPLSPALLNRPLPEQRRGALAAICCAVMALYALYLGAIGVVLPSIGATFGLGASVSARLFAADFSGFVVGVLVCGALSDRFGRKSVLLWSLILYAAGLGLFGAARQFAITLVASAFIGAGTGAMETVAAALASDLYPERRASILNAIQIAFGVGAAAGPAIANTVLTHGAVWRMLYFALAAVTAFLTLLLAVQPVPRPQQGVERVDFRLLLSVLKQPLFLWLCIAQALYVAAETGFFAWMPTYFRHELPGGVAQAGLVVTVFWIAMTAGRMATGVLLHRMPLLRLLQLFAVGGALGAAFALAWTSSAAVAFCVAWTGLCFGGIFGLIMAVTGNRYPTIAGTAFGGVMAFVGIGGAAGPWLIGALSEFGWGWRGALLAVPALMTALTATLLHLARISGPERAA